MLPAPSPRIPRSEVPVRTPFHRRAVGILADAPFFGLLAPNEIEAIAELFRSATLEAGEELFHRGDPPAHLYGLLSGCLKVYASHPDGRDVAFSLLGAGDIVGELGVADGAPRSASVVAIRETELVRISRRELGALIRRHPGIGIALSTTSVETVRRLSRRAEEAAFLALEARLAGVLLDLARRFGETADAGVRLRLRQQDLAELLGTTRESINKHLRSWAAGGHLSLGRGSVVIHDTGSLEATRSEAVH